MKQACQRSKNFHKVVISISLFSLITITSTRTTFAAENIPFTARMTNFFTNISGDFYPKVTGVGTLGIDTNRWNGLKLSNATIDAEGNLYLGGELKVGNDTTLGSGDKDTIKVKSRFISSLIPKSDDEYDLGSSSKSWDNIYGQSLDISDTLKLNGVSYSFPSSGGSDGMVLTEDGNGNLTWETPSGGGGTNFWQRNGSMVSPATITDKVGIGTISGAGKLNISSTSSINDIFINSPDSDNYFTLANSFSSGDTSVNMTNLDDVTESYSLLTLDTAQGTSLSYINPSGESSVLLGASTVTWSVGGAEALRIAADGNVGIGVLDPQYKLDVDGDINTTGEIRQNGAAYANPDYVFDPAYNLMPLDSLKEYVADNRHLPNVPSSEDIKRDGVRLFEQNRLNLEKIEEAYLYIFELDKKVSELTTSLSESNTNNNSNEQDNESDHRTISAGVITIPEGSREVEVNFEEDYEHAPVVTISKEDDLTDVQGTITNKSNSGFTIELNEEAANDIIFNWMAF